MIENVSRPVIRQLDPEFVSKRRLGMKKAYLALMVMSIVVLLTVTLAQGDETAGATPAAVTAQPASTPAPKAKTKKAKVSKKKEVKETWVCPMGDYSGPKTADGKCPKCGMDLVKKTDNKK
jgi:Heavy metal binding domain